MMGYFRVCWVEVKQIASGKYQQKIKQNKKLHIKNKKILKS